MVAVSKIYPGSKVILRRRRADCHGAHEPALRTSNGVPGGELPCTLKSGVVIQAVCRTAAML